jgi:hypothetical protein
MERLLLQLLAKTNEMGQRNKIKKSIDILWIPILFKKI